MGNVYRYPIWPKDPNDQRTYFWEKPDIVNNTVGYDESGTRASFHYGNFIYVINGYVDGIDPIFAYKIDKKTFFQEEIIINIDTSPGVSSQCFVDASLVSGFKFSDMKLIMRGQIVTVDGNAFSCVCKSVDPIYDGLIYLSFHIDIDGNVMVSMNTLTYLPYGILESTEILDNLGMYDGIFYFMGKSSGESFWRTMWSIDTYNNFSIGTQTLQINSLLGRQSFITYGKYCYVTGGYLEGTVPLWFIDLKSGVVTTIDYTNQPIRIPTGSLNPVLTSKGAQVFVLGPYTDIGFVGEVVRVDTGTKNTVGIETLTSSIPGQISANCGASDGSFQYYLDTRKGLLWIANIVDAVPFDTKIQLFDYECKFNGMVLMMDTVHSKIDDNKYIYAYK